MNNYLENNINNNINNNVNKNIEKEQKNIIGEILGKTINLAIDTGVRILLPNAIEDEIINIKDVLINEGLKEGIKNKSKHLDCLINELQGSVNSAWVDGDITEEQCDYLYKKYIHGGVI